MSKSDRTTEQIIRYLKNLLSNRDRHHLEKDMMQDVFDDEAFEGLNQLTGEQLQVDMGKLTGMLNQRTQHRKTIAFMGFRRIAAALIVLVGMGAILFFVLRKPAPEFISQDLKRNVTQTTVPEKYPNPVSEPPQKTDESIALQPSRLATGHSSGESELSSSPVEAEKKVSMSKPDPEVLDASEAIASAPAELFFQDSIEPSYITGRIVGADQEAIAGVSIMEKGNNKKGTLSDMNGNFMLSVNNFKSSLTVSHFGYEPVELTPEEAAGKDITLIADPMALSELVVIGYGTEKKEKISPSTSRKATSDTLITEIQAPFDLSKPVPPGESLKAFEKWVEDRVVFDLFNDQQGDYNIPVRLTIQKDGTVRNVRIGKEIPTVIAQEYARVIKQSPNWQPAQDNGTPVDAEVEIIFILMIR